MENSFGVWLLEELGSRGWQQGELCSRGRIPSGTLSNIISGNRDVGPDIARKIAIGFRMPEEEVFRRGGLLNEGRLTQESQSSRELGEKISMLSHLERLEVSEFVDYVLFQRQRADSAKRKNNPGNDLEEARS